MVRGRVEERFTSEGQRLVWCSGEGRVWSRSVRGSDGAEAELRVAELDDGAYKLSRGSQGEPRWGERGLAVAGNNMVRVRLNPFPIPGNRLCAPFARRHVPSGRQGRGGGARWSL